MSTVQQHPARTAHPGLFLVIFCYCLTIGITGCEDLLLTLTPTPPVSPGSDPLLRFPMAVGTVLEYQYVFIEGAASWGTMASRTESHGKRVWTVTASTGDSVMGTATVQVTGLDTVTSQANTSDFVHPGPITTSIVAFSPSTFTVIFSRDTMKIGFPAVMKTVDAIHGKFARKLNAVNDSLKTGTETFYTGLAVYQDGIGVKNFNYMHPSSFYVRGELLNLTSVRKPGGEVLHRTSARRMD